MRFEVGCPDNEHIVDHLAGTLPRDATDVVAAHLDSCDACRSLVAELSHGPLRAQKPPLPEEGEGTALGTGDVVGRYVIESLLGSGGMGAVYRARDSQLKRDVALKVLRPELVGSEGSEALTRRLVKEAQALARVSHPHVVSVFDVGIERNQVYLVLELVDGSTLGVWQRRTQRSWREILKLYLEAGQGLAAAHAVGLVHRDFKPENVLVDSSGRARVTDFGLARDHGEALAALDAEHKTDQRGLESIGLGTPAYMSPEQRLGQRGDPRSDQFSFALALCEALTPLPDAAHLARAGQRQALALARGGSLPRGIPRGLKRALRRALDPDPALRFASMGLLLRAASRASSRRWLPGALLGTAALLLAGLVRTAQTHQEDCRSEAARAVAPWTAHRDALAEKFEATKAPFASEAWAHVAGVLDAYSAQVEKGHRDACQDEPSFPFQSTTTPTRACWARAREELNAATEVLATVDAEAASRATGLVYGLPSLDACRNRTPATSEVPETFDVSRADELGSALARAGALERVARLNDAEALATDVVAKAGAALSPAFEARARFLLARVQCSSLRFSDCLATLRPALLLVERLGDEPLKVRLRILEASAETTAGASREAAARQALALAAATLERLGDNVDLKAAWHTQQGATEMATGHAKEALREFETALAMRNRQLSAPHPKLAALHVWLGTVQCGLGHTRACDAHFVAALDMEVAMGHPEGHSATANALGNIAAAAAVRGDYARALEFSTKALASRRASLGDRHARTLTQLQNQGEALAGLGKFEEALQRMNDALAFREVMGPDHVNVALVQQGRGFVLSKLDRAEEATRAFQEAVRIHQIASGPRSDDWALALCAWGRHALKEKRPGQALTLFERALERTERADSPALACGLTGKAEAALALKRPVEGARQLLERALKLRREFEGDPADVADTLWAMARAWPGNPTGREFAEQAADIYRTSPSRTLELAAVQSYMALPAAR